MQFSTNFDQFTCKKQIGFCKLPSRTYCSYSRSPPISTIFSIVYFMSIPPKYLPHFSSIHRLLHQRSQFIHASSLTKVLLTNLQNLLFFLKINNLFHSYVSLFSHFFGQVAANGTYMYMEGSLSFFNITIIILIVTVRKKLHCE